MKLKLNSGQTQINYISYQLYYNKKYYKKYIKNLNQDHTKIITT
jgi:hypothetical protein